MSGHGWSSLPAEKPGGTETIGAFTGWTRRRGAWRVPRNLKVESVFGRVHLDLSRAVIEDIENLRTTWKPSLYKAARRARPGGGPTIRISGARASDA